MKTYLHSTRPFVREHDGWVSEGNSQWREVIEMLVELLSPARKSDGRAFTLSLLIDKRVHVDVCPATSRTPTPRSNEDEVHWQGVQFVTGETLEFGITEVFVYDCNHPDHPGWQIEDGFPSALTEIIAKRLGR